MLMCLFFGGKEGGWGVEREEKWLFAKKGSWTTIFRILRHVFEQAGKRP